MHHTDSAPNPLVTTSNMRPEAMVWVDPSPGNAMFLSEGDKMDFLGSSDQQIMDDLDAFADFELPPVGKQDSIQSQAQDPWRGGYVWEIGAEWYCDGFVWEIFRALCSAAFSHVI